MKQTQISVWDGNKRRILDFAHRELSDLPFSGEINEIIEQNIREPIKSVDIIITAIQGPKLVGYMCVGRKETVGSIVSTLIMNEPERGSIVSEMVRECYRELVKQSPLEVIEFKSICFGKEDYISRPLISLGFMVQPQIEMIWTKGELPQVPNIDGITISPWREEFENEASQVIATSDLGDLEIVKELPEREPRYRWLLEQKEASGGKVDGSVSFMALRGNRLAGAVLAIDRGEYGEILALGCMPIPKSAEIMAKLVHSSLSGFIKKEVKTIRTTVPMFKGEEIRIFNNLGLVQAFFKPDAILLASDDAWSSLSEKVASSTP
ncbi:MAG TPA: hypothetical protein PL190_04020 [Caldisericia bacterium]|mgnify:FL=1|nr:hypothetical protein [Caldisericia bacterium]HNY60959.1 hypothetical protein [Caldisericia bacterium]HOC78891.1 hypothetical protein [Caldisericia bacterium]HOG69678.1 hypothetical protein [Caldisericia bacterium]HPA65676.1 hypothetical protein [Caldisericia bacterium]